MVAVILSLLMFGLLIFIHEFGHFKAARKCNINVYEFAVGIGPSLFKKNVNGTKYELKLFPVGGYIRMDPNDESEQLTNSSNDYLNVSPVKKMIVAVAGPLMNLIFAVLLFILFFLIIGVPNTTIDKVQMNSPAFFAGIESEDKVLEINGQSYDNWDDIVDTIRSSEENSAINIKVKKANNEIKEYQIVPINENGVIIIGITPKIEYNIIKAVPEGFKTTKDISVMMLKFVGELFQGHAKSDDLSGPIGIVKVMSDSVSMGFAFVIYMIAIISLNLGVLNLLPIPALDGSKIVFSLIELVTPNKKIVQKVENVLSIVGLGLLLLLIVFVSYKDIMRLNMGNL